MASVSTETARKLLDVTMLLMRSLAAEMRQSEERLSPVHVGLLARIDHGPCTLTELARNQSVRLPTASRSASLLVERGWVQRWRPAHNRRQTLFRLTPAGRRALAAMKRKAERHVAALLTSLSAAEHAKLNASLTVLQRTMHGQTSKGAG